MLTIEKIKQPRIVSGKKLTILLFALIFTQILMGQSIERQVIAFASGWHTNGNLQVGSTAGEPVVETISNSTITLTQGFQQPDGECQFGDTEAPIILNCPDDIHSCSPVTAFIPPTASDECNLVSFEKEIVETVTFTAIIRTVTYTATDEKGNSAQCIFDITQHPLPIANAGMDTTVNTGEMVTLGGSPTASGGGGSYSYLWNPPTGLSNTTDANPLAAPTSTTNYLVFVIDNWGCAGTDNVTVAVNPAADDGQSSKSRNGFDARLFPNPATELIYVNFEGIEELENVRFEVLDMPGRRIIESILPAAENNQLQINVSGWQPGQYFAQIVIGNEVVTKKFMVMK